MTRTYATDASHWRRYQPHLPPELRVDGPDGPEEARWDWRGRDIHIDRFPAATAKTAVIVLHGGGGYGRMLAPLGRGLHDAEHEVVLPDLPGYGLTDCDARSVRYDDWVALAADLAAVEHAKGRRVVLFGLSMGGMLALHAAAAAPPGVIDGVAATTLMDPRRAEVRRGAGRFPTPAWALRLPAADPVRMPMPLLAPIERMSSVPAINALCRRDPQGGGRRVALGLMRSWMTFQPAVEPAHFDRCPVLLAHPLADRWTPVVWSRSVLDEIPGAKRFAGLEGCEHWPMEQPGLSVLLEEVRRLCTDVAAGPPS